MWEWSFRQRTESWKVKFFSKFTNVIFMQILLVEIIFRENWYPKPLEDPKVSSWWYPRKSGKNQHLQEDTQQEVTKYDPIPPSMGKSKTSPPNSKGMTVVSSSSYMKFLRPSWHMFPPVFNSIWTGAKSSVVRATTRNVLHEDLLLLYVPQQTTHCASLMPASQPAAEPWSMTVQFGYWRSLSWLIKSYQSPYVTF